MFDRFLIKPGVDAFKFLKVWFTLSYQKRDGTYRLIIEKKPGTRYFVSERVYLDRKGNFLSHLKTATYIKVNATDTLKINTNQIYIYEILNNKGVKSLATWFQPVKKDFIFPEERNRGWDNFCFDQEHYEFINCTFPDTLKKIILPENGNITYSNINTVVNSDAFLSQAEKDIEKIQKIL